MLFEMAYPALYLSAKTRQTLRRAHARLGLAPRDMLRVTYNPESFHRVACWQLRRADVELMMRLAPMRAARLSVERFERTRRMPERGAAAAPDNVDVSRMLWRGMSVVLRSYGPLDGPRILALHGWNGRASMLRKLAEALAAEGWRVLVPDLPGHGDSEGARFSFYELGIAVAELFRDQHFDAVIGHSAGGLIAALAIASGLHAGALIPVGSPSSLSSLLRAYVEITQMPLKSLPFIERYYTRRYGVPPDSVGPSMIAKLPVRMLVIHEQSDWQVGQDNAYALAKAKPGTELLITTGYTHLSVVNAQPVQRAITDFLRSDTLSCGGADA
jgi:pimeloyl-ACP methyl ester carboxylesterase